MTDRTNIEYPYLPKDRQFKYVPHDHEHMQAAAEARARLAGDSLYPVGGVLVKDGQVIAKAGNGYSRGSGKKHVCPRIVHECPSGQGYDLCDLHDSPGHAEPMVIKAAEEAGVDPEGADFYMYGHWWCCEPCWKALIEAGVQDVYLVDDAYERFCRDKVFAQTLTPSVQKVYFAESLTNLDPETAEQYKKSIEKIGQAVADELNLDVYVPHLYGDPIKCADVPSDEIFSSCYDQVRDRCVTVAEVSYPSLGVGGELVLAHKYDRPIVLLSKKGSHVSRFALGNPAVVYHIEYEDEQQAARLLNNVLKQL
ncbi:deaminase [Patescibacteria group bacterium]